MLPLACVCREANQGAPLILLTADWLYPPTADMRLWILAFVLFPRQFPLYVLMYIKATPESKG